MRSRSFDFATIDFLIWIIHILFLLINKGLLYRYLNFLLLLHATSGFVASSESLIRCVARLALLIWLRLLGGNIAV